MRQFRYLNWTLPVLLVALSGAGAVGCKGSAKMQIGEPAPPPPPPPPPDQDGDGIPDPNDKCPTEPEDGNPPDPNDGCPNKDMDGDGIPVPQDQCPDQPETVNDFEDEDGCPDQKPIAQLKEKEVKINQQILFAKDSAKIEEGSMVVIDAVAKLLKENPDVQLVEVGGHASKEGSEWYNRDLTQRRVDSVMKALVDKGVEKSRLIAQGYGFYCLVDTADSEEANEKNRRVEFKILYRAGKDLEQERGCKEAIDKGVKLKALPALPKAKEDKAGAAAAPTEKEPKAATPPKAKPPSLPTRKSPAPAATPAPKAPAPAPTTPAPKTTPAPTATTPPAPTTTPPAQ